MSRRRSLAILVAAAVVFAATAVVAVAVTRPPAPRDEPVEVSDYRLLDADRLRLGYSPVTDSCGGGPLHTPDVIETPTTVVLGLTQTVAQDVEECSAYADIGRVVVALRTPLGDRRVVDASTGRSVDQDLAGTPFD